jgi:hypothetical protein
MNLSLEISPKVAALLAVLHDGQLTGEAAVGDVLRKLIDHAQQGVYRPGAWEREWIERLSTGGQFSSDLSRENLHRARTAPLSGFTYSAFAWSARTPAIC